MRGVERNVGIEEMRPPDPERFRCLAKRVAIAVECVAAARRDLRDRSGPRPRCRGSGHRGHRVPSGYLDGARPVGARGDDLDRSIARDPRQPGSWNDALELHELAPTDPLLVPVNETSSLTWSYGARGTSEPRSPAAIPRVRIATSSSGFAKGSTCFARLAPRAP